MATVTPRTISISVLVVALLGATLVLLFSDSIFAHNKSVAQWNPERITETLSLGEAKVIAVTLTADKELPRAVVRVSPEIIPYVSITPTIIGKIRKGTKTTLTVTVNIPTNSSATKVNGVIELEKAKQQDGRDERDDDSDSDERGKKKKTIGPPLPVTIEIVAERLPPDPGEAGKATLEGIDSDHDGVRDDIQRYIVLTVPESARHREALKVFARDMQHKLLAQSKEEAIQIAHESRISECLTYLGIGQQQRHWREVQALMLNTEARLRAVDVYNDRITGQVFPMLPDNLKRTACRFNVEAFPN